MRWNVLFNFSLFILSAADFFFFLERSLHLVPDGRGVGGFWELTGVHYNRALTIQGPPPGVSTVRESGAPYAPRD